MTGAVRRSSVLVVLVVVAATLGLAGASPPAAAADCPDAVEVPGADFSQFRCLPDLSTAGNDFRTTNGGSRENPVLQSEHTQFPPEPVPGVQVEGWFPDTCDRYEPEQASFMPTCENGLRRNGQFVLRVPFDWDGIHLVVAGAPGIRDRYAQDPIISDWVLARGWAYIGHDRGNTGLNFFRAGDDETGGSLTRWLPTVALDQWAGFMETAAEAASATLSGSFGGPPELVYASGASNGGYQTRLALERYPELYDGGVDWEGTFFTSGPTNPFVYLPPVLRAYPSYRSSDDRDAYRQIVHEGRMPPDSEPLWDYHYSIYWGATMAGYRPVFDPEYTEYVAAARTPVLPQDPDANYDYGARPAFVGERLDEVAVTGEINGKPLITLHGTLDALLPISTASGPYAEAVRASGNGDAYRYYVVEGANHVDSLADDHPETMRPLLPCYVEALDALDAWVVDGTAPPPSGFIPFPEAQTVEERANECPLPGRVERVAGPDRIATAVAASRGAHGISETVVLAAAGDYPDALTAAPLATALEAPLLLVGDGIDATLRRELERTGALRAVVVGGAAAVPATVDDDLTALGLDVERIAGRDRFATAVEVAARLRAEPGTDQDTAYVASGRSFADALAVAPVASASGTPILLTEPQALPDVTREALAGVASTVVVGGSAAVDDAVLEALPDPTRVAGVDRYATAVEVARRALRERGTVDQVAIADGRDFPDALSAGPVVAAGYGGAAPGGLVLLVDGGADDLPTGIRAFLEANDGAIGELLVFGGRAAVSDRVADLLER